MKAPAQQALVSVMMPVYNGDETLDLAITSLLKQTYTNWICIIVNDGSTDGTKKYLDALTDKRFKIIHFEKNKGRPIARQAALEAAEGDFLAFLDADDFFHPEKLEKQVNTFLKYPEVDLVSCGMGSFKCKTELLKIRGVNPVRANKVMKFVPSGVFNAPHAASMTRVNISKSIGYNKLLKHAQDTDFFIRYMQNRKYIIISDVLYYYSEFVSVTGKKILRTYKYDIIRKASLFKKQPVLAVKSIATTLLKGIVTASLLPFTGAEYFLKRRGVLPGENELREYDKVKAALNIDIQSTSTISL